MLRWALRSLLVSLLLSAIGFLSLDSWVFEVFRVAGGAFLALAVLLFILNYVLTPEPPEK